MKLEEVLPALRNGAKIRRREWIATDYVTLHNNQFVNHLGSIVYISFLLDDDWEIFEETDKTLSFNQLKMGRLYKIVEAPHQEWVRDIVFRLDFDRHDMKQGVALLKSNVASFSIAVGNCKECRFVPVTATFKDEL